MLVLPGYEPAQSPSHRPGSKRQGPCSRGGFIRPALCWVSAVLLTESACSHRVPEAQAPPQTQTQTQSAEYPEQDSQQPTRPRLVMPEELAALEKDILSVVEKNKTLSCPRQPLRDKPTRGPAAADILAVFEGTQALSACRELLEKMKDTLAEALFLPRISPDPNVQEWPEPRPIGDKLAGAEVLKRLERFCSRLLTHVRTAGRQGDVCSPYLAGLRGLPDVGPLLGSIRVLHLAARRLVEKNKQQDALRLLLDGIRFGQDASRGGGCLLLAMIDVAVTQQLLPVVKLILNQPRPLGKKLLQEIERELSLLIQSQIHPAVSLRGELQVQVLYRIQPFIHGPQWRPPGGWNGGVPPQRANQETIFEFDGAPLIGADAKDDAAVTWLALIDLDQKHARACAESAPPRQCQDGLAALEKQAMNRPAVEAHLKGLGAMTVTPEDVADFRQMFKDAIGSPGFLPMSPYVSRLGEKYFMLSAVRLQIAYRQEAERTRRCPPLSAFNKPPLKGKRIDSYSGSQIRVTSTSRGFLFRPPVSFGSGQSPQPAVDVKCPFAKRK